MIGQNYFKQHAAFGSVAGSIGIVLGVLVILGWFLESAVLVQILPTFTPMQFNTATCFLVSGLALVMLSQERLEASFWLGFFVLLLSSVTLSQYFLGTDVGLDNLVIDHHIITNTSHAGRMAPNTAVCFMLFGFTIALESSRPKNKRLYRSLYLSEFLSPLIIALATMSLFGYIFQNDKAVAWANLTGMAFHTTIGLMLLGGGLSILVWNQYGGSKIRQSFWWTAFFFYLCLALDISQPMSVAAGVAYVPAIFCSYWFRGVYSPFTFAGIATVMTMIGFFTSTIDEVSLQSAVLNRGLAILAIWITAYSIFYRKMSEARLLSSQQALKSSIKEVEQFAYIASHDLRAPLRAIGNLTQWLEEDLDGVLKDDTRENMDLLRGRVKRLDKLLDDILHFTRAGRFEQKMTHVDINSLLARIHEVGENSDEFALQLKAEMPTVVAPEGTMELIFTNLVNNAIVHHDRDSGTITVTSTEVDGEWVFRVIDDGPGIAEEYRERVFEMFKKLEGRDRVEGSGMGLSTVRKLVNLSNGQVWIESNMNGRGTCVSFSWPKVSIQGMS